MEPVPTQEAPRPKRPRPAEAPAVEAEPTLVIDIADAPEAPLSKECLLLPRVRVLDS